MGEQETDGRVNCKTEWAKQHGGNRESYVRGMIWLSGPYLKINCGNTRLGCRKSTAAR